jgi:hypothetical protein
MPTFRVVCYYNAVKQAEHRDVEAQDEHEAAERVCGGGPLLDAGKPGQLRAQVTLEAKPAARKMFYTRD